MHKGQKTGMSRLMEWIRRNIPSRYKPLIQDIVRYTQAIFYMGNRYECPCCGWRFRRMLTYGATSRPNARCPRCHSLERHRWFMVYLKEKIETFQHPHTLLHFAPEIAIRRYLIQHPQIRYYATDITNLPDYHIHVQMDITRISLESEAMDVILCNHVLEHIPDDRVAMRELYRILKPGGWMLVSVPMRVGHLTYEDDTIQSPSERHIAFWQHDHVRLYGDDFPDRLTEAGFTMTMKRADSLGEAAVVRYGLRADEIFFIASKT